MRKTNRKKSTRAILGILLLFIAGLSGSYIYQTARTSDQRSVQITQELSKICRCESVKMDIYSKGVFGEKGYFVLEECDYDNFSDEAERVNRLLSVNIRGYKEIDRLELAFKNEQEVKTVIVKNGVIQQSKNDRS